MLPGFPSSIPAGDHDSLLIVGVPVDLQDGITLQVPVRAPAGLGDCYWVWCADNRIGDVFRVAEGRERLVRVRLDPSRDNPHTVIFAPLGQ